MRIELLADAALRQPEPAELIELIAAVQRLIDTAAAYQRRLIAAAEAQRAARAMVANTRRTARPATQPAFRRRAGTPPRPPHQPDPPVGPASRYPTSRSSHQRQPARPNLPADTPSARHVVPQPPATTGPAQPPTPHPASHVTSPIYDHLMNIKIYETAAPSPDRDRCHTPSLGWSHAT